MKWGAQGIVQEAQNGNCLLSTSAPAIIIAFEACLIKALEENSMAAVRWW
jgi:hypothetical protein